MSRSRSGSGNGESRPQFFSEGVYKHDEEPWFCFIVRLFEDTFNPDQYKGECLIDGKRYTVVAVETKKHLPPWLKDEEVVLAVTEI